jgi:quinol monooxygenase YgiN
MISVIAHYTAAAGAEPGCLQFDAHQGIDNPTKGGNCRCTG